MAPSDDPYARRADADVLGESSPRTELGSAYGGQSTFVHFVHGTDHDDDQMTTDGAASSVIDTYLTRDENVWENALQPIEDTSLQLDSGAQDISLPMGDTSMAKDTSAALSDSFPALNSSTSFSADPLLSRHVAYSETHPYAPRLNVDTSNFAESSQSLTPLYPTTPFSHERRRVHDPNSSFASAVSPSIYQGPVNLSQGDFISTMHQDHYGQVLEQHGVLEDDDPLAWMNIGDLKETDDDMHDPNRRFFYPSHSPKRALLNLGTMGLLIAATLMLFAGYPILHHYTTEAQHKESLSSGHYPKQPQFNRNTKYRMGQGRTDPLIDPDTPPDAYYTSSTYIGPSTDDRSKRAKKRLKLVFSDEFQTDGRSFYPGDDPFWEAVDLNYWVTKNYEWYDPEAITTRDGFLEIKLERHEEHNLNFRGGMLQSWNKFCFTGGLLVASVQLPGRKDVPGLWPAFWIMGNLGRAGFGASLQGMWPYSYDKCDVGTLINQTFANGTPSSNAEGGNVDFNQKHYTRSLSYLPGQKLSACTCPDEDHPGPWDKKTKSFKGRAAPEVDVFEAQIDKGKLQMSQSCQIAPYNYKYNITGLGPDGKSVNRTQAYRFFTDDGELNLYTGEVTQQALSGTILGSQTAIQANAPKRVTRENYDEAFALCAYSLTRLS